MGLGVRVCVCASCRIVQETSMKSTPQTACDWDSLPIGTGIQPRLLRQANKYGVLYNQKIISIRPAKAG